MAPLDSIRPSLATRAVVAVNANASRLRDPEMVLDAVLAATGGAGVEVIGLVTESEADLRDAIDAADGGRLVLVGGDGGVHFALNAAPGPVEIGLVPMGTANNIARSLGLPRDLPRAARRAVTGTARPVDVLRVETPERSLFGVEGVSAGLHADARMRYESVNSGNLLEGAGAFASALGRYDPWSFELELDGRPAYRGRAAGLFLANFPLFAYGFNIDPGADVADGVLEAILLEAETRQRVARLVLSAYRGTLARRRDVTIAPGREAVIASPVPLVCDSEVLGTTTAAVRVEQGRLRIAA
jgi:diacylglycerol kinase (ATP)